MNTKKAGEIAFVGERMGIFAPEPIGEGRILTMVCHKAVITQNGKPISVLSYGHAVKSN